GYAGLLRAGAVVTGGSSQVPGFKDVALKALNIPVRMAQPENLTGMADTLKNPSYSTSVGLLRLGLEMDTVIESDLNGAGGLPAIGLGRRVSDFLRRFLPDDN
ncbi:MAG: cell division protein FtsA, partial [Phototrophicales bacterium]